MELNANLRYLSYQASLNGVKPGANSAGGEIPPVKGGTEVEHTPGESFTFSQTPLKTAREGSDMAQMVEDLQANGVIPNPPIVSPPPLVSPERVKPLREPTNDFMAQMVEDIKKDHGSGAHRMHIQLNDNGAIAMLDDQGYLGIDTRDGEPHPFYEHDKVHDQGQDHDHSHKADVMVGGHFGGEVMEHVGHQAHQAASELTTTAAAHGLGHAMTAAQEGANTLTDASDALLPSAHGLKNAAMDVAEKTSEHSAEVAHHLSTGLQVGLSVAAGASGLLAVPLTVNGVKELRAGLKEKDGEKIAEGAGGIVVGARSLAAGVTMSGMLTSSELIGGIAHGAATVLTPLGLVHAAIDTGIGVNDLRKGKKVEGILKIGMGVAVAATALGAGLPGTVAALSFLGAKIVYKAVTKKKHKKEAAETAERPQKQAEQVPIGSGGVTPVKANVPLSTVNALGQGPPAQQTIGART